MRNISLIFGLLLLVGCAQVNPGLDRDANHYEDAIPYNDPDAQSDFDELLAFGANMAKISASSRAEACRILLKRQKNPPGAGIHLHLMVGRLLSDACGDIPKILDGLASIPPRSLSDERMQRLVAIHTEALKRLLTVSKKVGTLERKQKAVQDVTEQKDAPGAKKDETRLLREKLEAIRSMEKHLDESGHTN